MSKFSPFTRGSQQIGAAEPEPSPIPGAGFLGAARVANTNTCRLSYHIPGAPDPSAGVGAPLFIHVISRKRESADLDPFADILAADDVIAAIVANAEKIEPLTADNLDKGIDVDIENDLDRNAENEENLACIEWAEPA